ncbi:uncharacterized protein J4E84_001288 [Alternaria hordeiaustralica]|uniref:uncharacterized protein n=1 Tax=Alternaria hordeiaustralica TaxID=1187925 RepID=UPI0020C24EA0|nr:uncharacterized protein J4E84_001288 [Alternaria hordeiaustralica]KAI4698153.1 hypothetical protein J4E84_001288 [Alternaria hordeiaustralica]
MSSPRPTSRRIRTISWADQIPKQAAKSPPPSSYLDVGEAQTKHGSEIAPLFAQEDFDSSPSSSTLSLNSHFSSSPHLPTQPPTHQPDTANAMPTSMRDLSPFKGKPLWEPDDDEWAELDASHISSTFKATFKEPSQHSPEKSTNTSTLSRFSATLTSFIPSSPTKRASEALLREEEALRDRLEELQNTYYSNPAGDICDKVMTSVFLPGSQYFHHNQSRESVRAPHVIDLEAYFHTQDPLVGTAYPRLSDAVATILSHTGKECVEAFLDPRVEEFVYRREVERNKAGSIFVIRRKGNTVIKQQAGSYRNLGFSLSWTLYVKAMIGATGLWYDTYASPVAGSTPIVDGVPAWDTFVPIGTEDPFLQLSPETSQPNISPRKIILSSPRPQKKEVEDEDDGISPTNEKFVLYQSRTLARYLLRDIWVRLEGRYECKATWEVDGVGREVRLRRALVGFGDEDDDE